MKKRVFVKGFWGPFVGMVALILGLAGCSSQDNSATDPTGSQSYSEISAAGSFGDSSVFTHPAGIIGDNSYLWIVDQGSNSLQKWSFATSTTRVLDIVTFNGGDTFNKPWGVAKDPVTGNIYVAGGSNGNVVIFDNSGNYLTKITVGVSDVRGVAISPSGDKAYVTDYNGGGYLYAIGGTPSLPTLTYSSSFGTSAPGKLTHALQCSVDGSGNVWVADYGGAKIEEYDSAGAHVWSLISSTNIKKPTDVQVLADGTIMVSDEFKTSKGRVTAFDGSGNVKGIFGRGDTVMPEGVAVVSGFIWVTDWSLAKVVIFG